MCLAIPLRISRIDGLDAVAERDGIRWSVRLDFIPEPKVGDYIIAHAGFAIERLPEEQAMENIAAAREVEEALREVRDALAQC